MIVLLALNVPHLLAAIITLSVMMYLYATLINKKNKSRLKLLVQDCNPPAFIDATEQELATHKRNKKAVAFLSIDKCAGLIAQGNFEEAKQQLLAIDTSYIAQKKPLLLHYNIYVATCLYELNEIEEAEEFYHNNILSLIDDSPKQELSIDFFEGEREFYLKNYEVSKEKLQTLIESNITLMSRMKVLYKLALIDLANDDKDDAIAKLKEVAEHGNKLDVAEKAHQQLVLLTT